MASVSPDVRLRWQHRHLSGPRVPCQPDKSPLTRRMAQRGIARVARRAGLSNVGVHILRHTFCSHLAMRGAPARAIQELAGHRSAGGRAGRRHGSWRVASWPSVAVAGVPLEPCRPGPPSSSIASRIRPRKFVPGARPSTFGNRSRSRCRRNATPSDPPRARSRRLAFRRTRRIMGCMTLSAVPWLAARGRRRSSRSARHGYQTLGYLRPEAGSDFQTLWGTPWDVFSGKLGKCMSGEALTEIVVLPLPD